MTRGFTAADLDPSFREVHVQNIASQWLSKGEIPSCHAEIAEIVMDCPRCDAREGELCRNAAGSNTMLPCIPRITEARRAGW